LTGGLAVWVTIIPYHKTKGRRRGLNFSQALTKQAVRFTASCSTLFFAAYNQIKVRVVSLNTHSSVNHRFIYPVHDSAKGQ